MIKKKDPEREKRMMFNGISCEKSFYFLSKQNKFRIFCYKLYKQKIFDNYIMFLIGISSVKLATDSYLTDYAADSI